MLGSGKAKRGDTKLLDNVIAAQKKLASALTNARTSSESSGLATSAWATPDGPSSMQKTAILTRALASTGAALDDYTVAVNGFTQGLQDLLPQEAAVAEVSRDRAILVSRLVRITKKKPKSGQEDKHLSVLANTQQELAACETVLASEQNALSQTRHQTLSEHARARLLALHLFGAQTQQFAAEALQQLDSLDAYAAAPSPPQTPHTAQIPVQQGYDARSIALSYRNQQQAAPYNGSVQTQPYATLPTAPSASFTPGSVYEAAPSYQSAEGLTYPRDAQVPTVAPVQEGNEDYEGSSVFEPSSQPGAEGGAEAEADVVAIGAGANDEAVPSRRYSSEAPGAPSPYRSAEVGYVPGEPVAAPSGSARNDDTIESQQPVAIVTGVASGPLSDQPAVIVDEVFMTPVEEVGYNQLQGGYSSSDPDDNAQEHLGPYAAGMPRRSVSNPHPRASTRSGATAQPQVYRNRSTRTRTTGHRKHNSEPNDNYIFGPDGAIDAVGQPGRISARRDFDDDSSVDESQSPKLSRHLSLMGKSKKNRSKHHSSNGSSPNFLSRLNSVLKTDITVAAAEAAHQDIPEDVESRGGLLHRSHSLSSGKHHQQPSKRSSRNAGGNSVLPVEEGGSSEEEFNPRVNVGGSGNPVHSTWKTRTDKNLRDLGTEAPAPVWTAKRSSKGISSSPLSSRAPPPLEPGSYGAPAEEASGLRTPVAATRGLDAEASSLTSTEPQTPLANVGAWAQSPAIAGTARTGTGSADGTPITRRKNLSPGSPLKNASYTPNLAASQQDDFVASPGLALESPLSVERDGEATSTGYPSGNWTYPEEKPSAMPKDGGPVLVKKVMRVKKTVKKPSTRRSTNGHGKSTGSGKGHTYETVRYASSQGSATPGSPGGGLYQVTAPGSALDGFPSVPKAPRASDYTRPFRTSRHGAPDSRGSNASSQDALPDYLRTQSQRASSGYGTSSKPYSSVARGVLA